MPISDEMVEAARGVLNAGGFYNISPELTRLALEAAEAVRERGNATYAQVIKSRKRKLHIESPEYGILNWVEREVERRLASSGGNRE